MVILSTRRATNVLSARGIYPSATTKSRPKMNIEQMALAIVRAGWIRDMALGLFWLHSLDGALDGWADKIEYTQALAESVLDGAISYKEAERLMGAYGEAQTRRLELRDEKLEGPAEDRQEESLSQKEDGKA